MHDKAPTRAQRSQEAQRLLEGLNGQWVAGRLGVSDATIGAWRRGERVPGLDDLLQMAAAVGRPLHPDLRARVVELLAFSSPVVQEDAIEAARPAVDEAVEQALAEAEPEAARQSDDDARRAANGKPGRSPEP